MDRQWREVSKSEFKAFVLKHELSPVSSNQCQDLQDDYINSSNEVLATHEMIGCGSIYHVTSNQEVFMSEELTTRSNLNGHPIAFVNEKWVYENDLALTPGYGGKNRPCTKCGKENVNSDECLGMLPGVTAACCGHGDPEQAYIIFNNGVVVRGFTCVENSQITG